MEDTFEEYIENLMEIFMEIKRVLKKSGSFYLNIGDSFSGTMCGYGATQKSKTGIQDASTGIYAINVKKPLSAKDSGVPRKSMFGIPERFMLKMIDAGFILRNKIIWRKVNHMPGSQKDRLTCSWEPIYHFVKNNKGSDWYVYGNEPSQEKFPEKHKIWLDMPEKFRSGCWHKDNIPKDVLPGFLNLDYYYDLDIIREPHKFVSLKRYQSALEYGSTFASDSKAAESSKIGGNVPKRPPKSFQAFSEGQKMSVPPKEDGICAVPKNIKRNWREGNKEKGYPEKPPKGISLGGGQTGLNIRHTKIPQEQAESFGSPRARNHRTGRGGNSPELNNRNFMSGRSKTEDESSFKADGMRQDFEPGEKGAFNIKGKNPSDFISERVETNIEHFSQKGEGGNYLYGGIDSEEAKHANIKGKNPSDFFDVTTVGFAGSHFAVFPVALLFKPILSSCPKGGTILDIFSGSGTTSLVAKVLKRNYVGIDISEKYVQMSEDRIRNLEEQEKVMIKLKEKHPKTYAKFIGQKELF